MDAAIADRRYLAPAVASPNPLFHFLSKKFLDSSTRTWHASLTRLLFFVRPRPQLKEKRKIRSGLRDYFSALELALLKFLAFAVLVLLRTVLESIKDSGNLVSVADLMVIDNQSHETLQLIVDYKLASESMDL